MSNGEQLAMTGRKGERAQKGRAEARTLRIEFRCFVYDKNYKLAEIEQLAFSLDRRAGGVAARTPARPKHTG